MRLIVPIGPPGCGKSTWVRQQLEAEVFAPSAVVSPDDLRLRLTGDAANQSANGTVFRIVEMILSERFNRGLDVVLDATNLEAKHLIPVIELATRAYEVMLFPFATDEAVIRQRNRQRDRVVPEHAMDRMLARYERVDELLAEVAAACPWVEWQSV